MNRKKYLLGLLFVALASAALFKFVFSSSLRCDAFGGGPGTFIAYCGSGTHGHYDHAAYLFDLEDGLAARVRRANVLFLGSSRVQAAFSTSALTRFSATHPDIVPYLLGFGYVEQDVFSSKLLETIKPKPAVIVINVDPFFSGFQSDHARRLMNDTQSEKVNAHIKKFWHPISEAACQGRVPVVGHFICGPTNTFYRSIADGRWIWHGEHLPKLSVTEVGPEPLDAASIADGVSHAESFLARLPVDRRCVVLTYAPKRNGNTRIATGIADRLGLRFIAPKLDGLSTYDGSHLDTVSAERWSAAFLVELEPLIRSCLH